MTQFNRSVTSVQHKQTWLQTENHPIFRTNFHNKNYPAFVKNNHISNCTLYTTRHWKKNYITAKNKTRKFPLCVHQRSDYTDAISTYSICINSRSLNSAIRPKIQMARMAGLCRPMSEGWLTICPWSVYVSAYGVLLKGCNVCIGPTSFPVHLRRRQIWKRFHGSFGAFRVCWKSWDVDLEVLYSKAFVNGGLIRCLFVVRINFALEISLCGIFSYGRGLMRYDLLYYYIISSI